MLKKIIPFFLITMLMLGAASYVYAACKDAGQKACDCGCCCCSCTK